MIVEIKTTLAGVEKRFDCRLLAGDARRAVVLWVASAPMQVHGIDLPSGTISFGHFWADRHYNVYHWVDGARRTIGFYFNLADRTRISEATLEWRDLVLDVIATPSGRLELLDEDELPAWLDPEVAAHIEDGKAAIFADPERLMAEIEAASRAHYHQVFPSPS
jgi:predicted RNA-binding protein associated with RNAse of E/G family